MINHDELKKVIEKQLEQIRKTQSQLDKILAQPTKSNGEEIEALSGSIEAQVNALDTLLSIHHGLQDNYYRA